MQFLKVHWSHIVITTNLNFVELVSCVLDRALILFSQLQIITSNNDESVVNPSSQKKKNQEQNHLHSNPILEIILHLNIQRKGK